MTKQTHSEVTSEAITQAIKLVGFEGAALSLKTRQEFESRSAAASRASAAPRPAAKMTDAEKALRL